MFRSLFQVLRHKKIMTQVQEGTEVSQGEVIAEVGNTGLTTGYHLHFEVRVGEKPVDPLGHVKP